MSGMYPFFGNCAFLNFTIVKIHLNYHFYEIFYSYKLMLHLPINTQMFYKCIPAKVYTFNLILELFVCLLASMTL